jgi:hypothetical protein
MKYKAILYNNACPFDSVNLSNVNDIKEWAKGRGYSYFLSILATYDGISDALVINYHVKNNKFCKVKK